MTGSITVAIPPRFYEDHVERECRTGVVVKTTKAKVTVTLDAEDFDDLFSDAWYYSNPGEAVSFDGQGLRQSALATFRALRTAWPDRAEAFITKHGMP